MFGKPVSQILYSVTINLCSQALTLGKASFYPAKRGNESFGDCSREVFSPTLRRDTRTLGRFTRRHPARLCSTIFPNILSQDPGISRGTLLSAVWTFLTKNLRTNFQCGYPASQTALLYHFMVKLASDDV